MESLHSGTGAFARRQPELPAFCRTRRPAFGVSTRQQGELRFLLLLVLLFQLSTLLLVMSGLTPQRPAHPPATRDAASTTIPNP